MALTSEDFAAVRALIQATAQQARSAPSPLLLRPATVQSFDAPAQRAIVLIDADVSPVEVVNVTGEYLMNGSRVMVMFQPPHGAFVVGQAAPTAWQAWAPAVQQNAVAVAATLVYGHWTRIGDVVHAQARFNVTGAGTVGFPIVVTPVPVQTTVPSNTVLAGSVSFWDASTTTWYAGDGCIFGTDAFGVISAAVGAFGSPSAIGAVPPVALANGDRVLVDLTWRPIS